MSATAKINDVAVGYAVTVAWGNGVRDRLPYSGRGTATVGASGVITYAVPITGHSGPFRLWVQPRSPSTFCVARVASWSGLTVTMQLRDAAFALLATGTAVEFDWLALPE